MRTLVKKRYSSQNDTGEAHGHPSCYHICLCADLLKGLQHIEDRQNQLSDAEVMTAAIDAGNDAIWAGEVERHLMALELKTSAASTARLVSTAI
jgi:hypothetical protein